MDDRLVSAKDPSIELSAISRGARHWKPEEDAILLQHVVDHGTRAWGLLVASGKLPRRDNKACCNRFLHLKRQYPVPIPESQSKKARRSSGARQVPTLLRMPQDGGGPMAMAAFADFAGPSPVESVVDNASCGTIFELQANLAMTWPPAPKATNCGSARPNKYLIHGTEAKSNPERHSSVIAQNDGLVPPFVATGGLDEEQGRREAIRVSNGLLARGPGILSMEEAEHVLSGAPKLSLEEAEMLLLGPIDLECQTLSDLRYSKSAEVLEAERLRSYGALHMRSLPLGQVQWRDVTRSNHALPSVPKQIPKVPSSELSFGGEHSIPVKKARTHVQASQSWEAMSLPDLSRTWEAGMPQILTTGSNNPQNLLEDNIFKLLTDAVVPQFHAFHDVSGMEDGSMGARDPAVQRGCSRDSNWRQVCNGSAHEKHDTMSLVHENEMADFMWRKHMKFGCAIPAVTNMPLL